MDCSCSVSGKQRNFARRQEIRTGVKELKSLSSNPIVCETPEQTLGNWLTPTSLFYIRSHFESPVISDFSGSDWTVSISGSVANPYEFGVEDLSVLPKQTFPVTLECAGNNRSDLYPKVPGNPFQSGAVSNAVWSGVSLNDVLTKANVNVDTVEFLFEGLDKGVPEPGLESQPYMRSLPVEVARHPDTLLAYEMNGETLTLDHGFPLRLIVPNWYGMASVKWLTAITAITQPFKGYFQRNRYVFRDFIGNEKPVCEIKIKSHITFPQHEMKLNSEIVRLSGFALSGRSAIELVEISVDGGKAWKTADLVGPSHKYSWQQWQFVWAPSRPGHHTILSKARDQEGNVQPLKSEWNQLGYAANACKPICVEVV